MKLPCNPKNISFLKFRMPIKAAILPPNAKPFNNAVKLPELEIKKDKANPPERIATIIECLIAK